MANGLVVEVQIRVGEDGLIHYMQPEHFAALFEGKKKVSPTFPSVECRGPGRRNTCREEIIFSREVDPAQIQS